MYSINAFCEFLEMVTFLIKALLFIIITKVLYNLCFSDDHMLESSITY